MFTTPRTLLDKLRLPDQEDAWKRFVSLYTPLLLIWARRRGFQDADAADIIQDVLVKLLDLLPTYQQKPGGSFRRWLFKICQNQSRDYLRRVATRRLPGVDGLSNVDDSAEKQGPELEEAEYRLMLVHRARALIRTDFSEKTWAAFDALMLEHIPAEQVAARLDMTVNAVYQARHRILARLREEVDGFLN